MCLSLRQQISDIILDNTGLVFISKNQVSDPLSHSGFLEWEGELIHDLAEKTKDSRRDGAGLAAALVWLFNPRDERFKNQVVNSLREKLQPWIDETVSSAGEIISERMNAIAQASADSWAMTQIGLERTLSRSELAMISGIAGAQNLFVSRYFNQTLFENLESEIDRTLLSFSERLITETGIYGEIVESVSQTARNSIERTVNYWPQIATNGLNVARNAGSVFQFNSAGISRMVYYNPKDERTTPFCWMIADQVVYVSSAMEKLSKMSEAQSVEEYQASAPFVQRTQNPNEFELATAGGGTLTISPQNVGNFFRDGYLLIPPFHPRCRTLLLPEENEENNYA